MKFCDAGAATAAGGLPPSPHFVLSSASMKDTNNTKDKDTRDTKNTNQSSPQATTTAIAAAPQRHAIPPAFLVREGRPTKYHASIAQKIGEHLRAGLNFRQTCAVLGIGEQTLRQWRREKPELCAEISRAQGQAVADRLALINTAATKSWQAAAWWLERKYPHDWGRPTDLTVDAKILHVHEDEAAVHEYQRTVLEQKLRYALNLAPNATDEEVQYAFETKQINVGRSRLWGIPEDELPE